MKYAFCFLLTNNGKRINNNSAAKTFNAFLIDVEIMHTPLFRFHLSLKFHTSVIVSRPLILRTTMEPRYNDVPRDWRNYIVISGYRYKRIPRMTILAKNNHNYRYIGVRVMNI